MDYRTVKLKRWSNLRFNVNVTGDRGKKRPQGADARGASVLTGK